MGKFNLIENKLREAMRGIEMERGWPHGRRPNSASISAYSRSIMSREWARAKGRKRITNNGAFYDRD